MISSLRQILTATAIVPLSLASVSSPSIPKHLRLQRLPKVDRPVFADSFVVASLRWFLAAPAFGTPDGSAELVCRCAGAARGAAYPDAVKVLRCLGGRVWFGVGVCGAVDLDDLVVFVACHLGVVFWTARAVWMVEVMTGEATVVGVDIRCLGLYGGSGQKEKRLQGYHCDGNGLFERWGEPEAGVDNGFLEQDKRDADRLARRLTAGEAGLYTRPWNDRIRRLVVPVDCETLQHGTKTQGISTA
ncbi:hypothetical protein CDD80_6488 [Ophiocordyceps camponoti-rufipedis]|uniref:Uncharacterized protein n=1 Tax=Ophiocordyceps camponoti-rufipedis TaxID=2004952 RepID=A0A2C5ZF81_9HYPO|nr:hypothetical protein CDD80_6488 [Ophiocordyceps camponoti-rufipedis]